MPGLSLINNNRKMLGVGVDIIETARINRAVGRWGERFLRRIFTERELELYRNKPASLAARFAGKEAVIKVLGARTGGSWREIEILSGPGGKPFVHLYGKVKNRARKLGTDDIAISLSHCREYAIAFAVGGASPD
jgi:holo-[acyl-carrier protein] synthase